MKSPRTKSERCSLTSITERSATAGVKFSTMMLRAMGIVTFGTIFSIPNACLSEPATCLNFGTSVSAKLNSNTKNAMSRVAMSAKVAIQAGAPPPAHFGQSSLGSSGFGGPGGGRSACSSSGSASPSPSGASPSSPDAASPSLGSASLASAGGAAASSVSEDSSTAGSASAATSSAPEPISASGSARESINADSSAATGGGSS